MEAWLAMLDKAHFSRGLLAPASHIRQRSQQVLEPLDTSTEPTLLSPVTTTVIQTGAEMPKFRGRRDVRPTCQNMS